MSIRSATQSGSKAAPSTGASQRQHHLARRDQRHQPAQTRIEEALREERQRLDSVIESTNLGTWMERTKRCHRIQFALGVHARLPPEELAPLDINTWVKLTHPEDLERCQARAEQHFGGTLAYYNSILRMRHKAGHWVWVNARGGWSSARPRGCHCLCTAPTSTSVPATNQG